MRITTRGVNAYGFVAIAVMLAMIVMVFFNMVPRAWQWRLFAFALTLFAIRIGLRLMLARQKRLDDEERARLRGAAGQAGGDAPHDDRV
jgi:hypothetical protein